MGDCASPEKPTPCAPPPPPPYPSPTPCSHVRSACKGDALARAELLLFDYGDVRGADVDTGERLLGRTAEQVGCSWRGNARHPLPCAPTPTPGYTLLWTRCARGHLPPILTPVPVTRAAMLPWTSPLPSHACRHRAFPAPIVILSRPQECLCTHTVVPSLESRLCMHGGFCYLLALTQLARAKYRGDIADFIAGEPRRRQRWTLLRQAWVRACALSACASSPTVPAQGSATAPPAATAVGGAASGGAPWVGQGRATDGSHVVCAEPVLLGAGCLLSLHAPDVAARAEGAGAGAGQSPGAAGGAARAAGTGEAAAVAAGVAAAAVALSPPPPPPTPPGGGVVLEALCEADDPAGVDVSAVELSLA
jgi:hypothetical protein